MHDINYGGAAKMFAFLANGLEKLNNDVYVYTYEGNNPSYPLSKGIKYYPSKYIPKSKFLRRVLPFIGVRKHIKKIQPDVVISFLPNSNVYSVFGTLFTNCATIITERSDPYSEQGFLLNIKRLFYRFADGAVFQTEKAKKYYSKHIQEKSAVIPNPISKITQVQIPYDKKNNEIIHVARFDIKQKRQDLMVFAFKKVLQKYPDVKLVFCGDGKDFYKIVNLVMEEGIEDNVIFEGKVDNVLERINKAKIFVLTSDYEGIPNALAEAMAVGLPVISTNCSPGGAELLIENYKNGIIVPAGDVNGIAEAIIFLLDNPWIAEKYAKEARKITEKYSPENIIQKWDKFIEEIIKQN